MISLRDIYSPLIETGVNRGNICKNSKGFTLLELIIVVAILAVIVIPLTSGMDNWGAGKTHRNISHELQNYLSNARNEAMSRGVTSRVNLALSSGIYTATTFLEDNATTSCLTTGDWTQTSTVDLDLPKIFNINGSGVGDVCFYRDGSSSGGIYNIVQDNGGDDIGSAVITVTMATGYLDVEE